ncbi:Protein of unknown function [Cotesia congregata]|uniref:Uncharacterized protein n=1 Tax=Cotesia congregata TaxID=51543 RepID=A0A8J2HL09_COTCN|nr:Protein of unknown function [Cotesia congregata]
MVVNVVGIPGRYGSDRPKFLKSLFIEEFPDVRRLDRLAAKLNNVTFRISNFSNFIRTLIDSSCNTSTSRDLWRELPTEITDSLSLVTFKIKAFNFFLDPQVAKFRQEITEQEAEEKQSKQQKKQEKKSSQKKKEEPADKKLQGSPIAQRLRSKVKADDTALPSTSKGVMRRVFDKLPSFKRKQFSKIKESSSSRSESNIESSSESSASERSGIRKTPKKTQLYTPATTPRLQRRQREERLTDLEISSKSMSMFSDDSDSETIGGRVRVPPFSDRRVNESDDEPHSEVEENEDQEDVKASRSGRARKIIETRDQIFMQKNNYLYFIDEYGQPVDSGATKLEERSLLPKFKNLQAGSVAITKIGSRHHIAIVVNKGESLSWVVRTLTRTLTRLNLRTISIAKSSSVNETIHDKIIGKIKISDSGILTLTDSSHSLIANDIRLMGFSSNSEVYTTQPTYELDLIQILPNICKKEFKPINNIPYVPNQLSYDFTLNEVAGQNQNVPVHNYSNHSTLYLIFGVFLIIFITIAYILCFNSKKTTESTLIDSSNQTEVTLIEPDAHIYDVPSSSVSLVTPPNNLKDESKSIYIEMRNIRKTLTFKNAPEKI